MRRFKTASLVALCVAPVPTAAFGRNSGSQETGDGHVAAVSHLLTFADIPGTAPIDNGIFASDPAASHLQISNAGSSF